MGEGAIKNSHKFRRLLWTAPYEIAPRCFQCDLKTNSEIWWTAPNFYSLFSQLNDNNICRVNRYAFRDTASLRSLSLKNNRLTRLPQDAFNAIKNQMMKFQMSPQKRNWKAMNLLHLNRAALLIFSILFWKNQARRKFSIALPIPAKRPLQTP